MSIRRKNKHSQLVAHSLKASRALFEFSTFISFYVERHHCPTKLYCRYAAKVLYVRLWSIDYRKHMIRNEMRNNLIDFCKTIRFFSQLAIMFFMKITWNNSHIFRLHFIRYSYQTFIWFPHDNILTEHHAAHIRREKLQFSRFNHEDQIPFYSSLQFQFTHMNSNNVRPFLKIKNFFDILPVQLFLTT